MHQPREKRLESWWRIVTVTLHWVQTVIAALRSWNPLGNVQHCYLEVIGEWLFQLLSFKKQKESIAISKHSLVCWHIVEQRNFLINSRETVVGSKTWRKDEECPFLLDHRRLKAIQVHAAAFPSIYFLFSLDITPTQEPRWLANELHIKCDCVFVLLPLLLGFLLVSSPLSLY